MYSQFMHLLIAVGCSLLLLRGWFRMTLPSNNNEDEPWYRTKAMSGMLAACIPALFVGVMGWMGTVNTIGNTNALQDQKITAIQIQVDGVVEAQKQRDSELVNLKVELAIVKATLEGMQEDLRAIKLAVVGK